MKKLFIFSTITVLSSATFAHAEPMSDRQIAGTAIASCAGGAVGGMLLTAKTQYSVKSGAAAGCAIVSGLATGMNMAHAEEAPAESELQPEPLAHEQNQDE